MFLCINMTPDGKNKKDCVLRALSYALDLPYSEIFEYLDDYKKNTKMRSYNRQKNVIEGINSLLGYECIYSKRQSITTFIKNHSKGLYIILVTGHLTVVHNSDVIDTWDCSRKFVKCYWRVV